VRRMVFGCSIVWFGFVEMMKVKVKVTRGCVSEREGDCL
jgi:hypothetical protein